MDNEISGSIWGRAVRFLALATLALCIGGVQASANSLPATGIHIAPERDPSGVERNVLQNEQRMLQYQREHQRFMEDLRRVPPAEQVRPQVPQMQPSCRITVYGNKWLRTCR